MKTNKKQFFIFVVFILSFSGVFMSCNQQKSYQELLREEKRAIERFIDNNDFVILKEYPKDGIFGEKEFYKTTEGLYFHVVDSGNSNRVKYLNEVTVRYELSWNIKYAAKRDSSQIIRPSLPYPESFVYGYSQTYTGYSSVCTGWVIPLSYVGEDAVIDLIIPSSLGSSADSNSIIPEYYKNLHYTRFN
jgi:hypothetical protein